MAKIPKIVAMEGRDAIIAAAGSLFAEEGFATVAISAIANRSGLTRASLYDNFGSKTGLGLAVLESLGKQLKFSENEILRAQNFLDLAIELYSTTLKDKGASFRFSQIVTAAVKQVNFQKLNPTISAKVQSLQLLLSTATFSQDSESHFDVEPHSYVPPIKANLAVTIHDVASHSGTSAKTVSRVINDAPGVSLLTRDKVMNSMRELGYMPNAYAQRLSRSNSDVVGLLVDDLSTFPFAVDIIRGAQSAAQEQNKTLFIVDYESDDVLLGKIIRQFKSWQIDSLILASPHHKKVNPRLLDGFGKVFLVNCFDEMQKFSSIVPNEEQGAFMATNLLIEHGHKRIGFINGDPSFPATSLRLRGYKSALKKAGIAFEAELVRNGDWWQESGYSQMKQLMKLQDRPTSVFCANDWMAMGAYTAAIEEGLNIPQDVSIVGFDDREVISAHMFPKLTTIALPYFEMGKEAMGKLSHAGFTPKAETIDCRLVFRDSVK